MKKIIGLCGNRRVGKDTLCTLLRHIDDGIIRHAFADELKNDLAPLFREKFGVDIHTLDGEMKEKLRPMLISYGLVWRSLDPIHWVKIVNEKIISNPSLVQCVVDFRFENEIQFFKNTYKENFILIGIDRIGAPEPTEEESKHWPNLLKHFDHFIKWPTVDDDINKLSEYAMDIYKTL